MLNGILLVGNTKGGVGKSTLAVNIATMHALRGFDVLLVDTDEQASSMSWAAVRQEEGITPAVPAVIKTGKVGRDLALLRPKFDLVVVDAGAGDSVALKEAMAVCDQMVSPLQPEQFDAWALGSLLRSIRDVEARTDRRLPVRLLLNKLAPSGPVRDAEIGRVQELLEGYAGRPPTMAATLCRRKAVSYSAMEGRAVVEYDGRSPSDLSAKAEFERVMEELS